LTEAGAATTTGTVIGASVTDTLGKATEQRGPFQDAIHVVKYLLLGIAVEKRVRQAAQFPQDRWGADRHAGARAERAHARCLRIPAIYGSCHRGQGIKIGN
jgi:hypothetical protein